MQMFFTIKILSIIFGITVFVEFSMILYILIKEHIMNKDEDEIESEI